MEYRDVVIHINHGIFGKDHEVRKYPPIEQRVELAGGVWIGRLEGEVARVVMDVCSPKVLGVPSPVIQFAQLYSFVRELKDHADILRFDDDNELTGIIGVSRLIHPTSVGFVYAARLGYESGSVKEIFPAQIVGISKEAFLSPNRSRDWLTANEGAVLGDLAPKVKEELPRRIHNALWHHEYAARTYFLDHRWTLVCTGLEALVHTDRHGNTAQFTRRVPLLSAELGVSISEAEAVDAYDLRSRLAHGVTFLSTGSSHAPTASQIALYDRLEDALRLAVLRSMRDRHFSDIFRDDAQIRARWPI